MSCGVGCRRSSDPKLLWLWCGPVATAPIRPLAWAPPYAAGAAQEKAKRQKKKKKRKEKKERKKKKRKEKPPRHGPHGWGESVSFFCVFIFFCIPLSLSPIGVSFQPLTLAMLLHATGTLHMLVPCLDHSSLLSLPDL